MTSTATAIETQGAHPSRQIEPIPPNPFKPRLRKPCSRSSRSMSTLSSTSFRPGFDFVRAEQGPQRRIEPTSDNTIIPGSGLGKNAFRGPTSRSRPRTPWKFVRGKRVSADQLFDRVRHPPFFRCRRSKPRMSPFDLISGSVAQTLGRDRRKSGKVATIA